MKRNAGLKRVDLSNSQVRNFLSKFHAIRYAPLSLFIYLIYIFIYLFIYHLITINCIAIKC